MLEFVKGDFFKFDADVRINTVNCVGVMGAGVALAFKNKYPAMFKEYLKDCKAGVIKPGLPSVWKNDDMFTKEIEIINFPTKDHWRKPSEYEYVENGLKWLSEYLQQKSYSTITLPALGCGHGGLDWGSVKHLIENHLGDSKHKILVFEPNSSKNAGKVELNTPENNQLLTQENIKIITSKSTDYPDNLRMFTEKDLYLFSSNNTSIEKYDISIISSSKPSSSEIELVKKLVHYCEAHSFSILFGSSAFDKKMAFEATKKGLNVGVFLPTSIFNSAKKANVNVNLTSLTLLSIGDPFESFDRKAYMPSVLSRLFLAGKAIFTTSRLEWVSKQATHINKSDCKFYYTGIPALSEKDTLAIEKISAIKIEVNNESINFG
jgi:O-acetyl-ADP-ribose deacetylase (regulator of RNase III)